MARVRYALIHFCQAKYISLSKYYPVFFSYFYRTTVLNQLVVSILITQCILSLLRLDWVKYSFTWFGGVVLEVTLRIVIPQLNGELPSWAVSS